MFRIRKSHEIITYKATEYEKQQKERELSEMLRRQEADEKREEKANRSTKCIQYGIEKG